jgi:exodeoxyribonuclease V beta subunit
VAAGVVLRDGDGPARTLGYGDVRVLAGTAREGQILARALARLGVPCVAFKQKGLFQTGEAADLLDVLRAVEDPGDPGCRARAMLTPLFGYRLADLEGLAAMPGDHPVLQQLQDWRQLGRERQFPRMLESMLVDSGLVRRLRLRSGNERALTNYLHLAELLASAGAEGATGLEALTRRLNRWIQGLELPAGREPDLQRLEGQDDAVQIMTLHASKGLEGGIVAVFAHSQGQANILHRFHLEGRRCATFDRGLEPYRTLIDDGEREEEERLMYVALTRARALLILPCYLETSAKGEPLHPGSDYRVVNRRLLALADGDQRPDLFRRKDAELPEGLGAQVPDPDLSGWALPALAPAPAPDFPEARRLARPAFNASYTSITALLARRTVRAETPDLDTDQPAVAAPAGQLPRGPQTGQAIHELLEAEDTREAMALAFEPWWQDPSRRARVRAVLAEHGLASRWDDLAARMVHGALNTVLPDRDGPGGPLGVHDRLLREMGFQARFLDTGDYLNGSMDAVYERDGAAWFLDWKTDTLASYGPEALAAHVAEHFTVQFRIYARVLLDFLGIADEAAYERRFGGIHYVFLRSPGAVLSFRPTWAEVAGWDAYLRDLHRMVAHA